MTAASPWMKFYPQDWRADEKLRMCSLAARGLWIEMLALMHRSERYGHLLINGHVPTDAQLAIQVGASPDQVAELLGELEAAGVFSRAAGSAIYSRRMTRDEKKARIARKNGQRGGNPNLRNNEENSPSDKGRDNHRVNGGDKAQRPEARGQSSDTDVSGGPEPPIDWQKVAFDRGVEVLGETGTPAGQARSLVGRWRKSVSDERLAELLDQARGKAEPIEWMTAAVRDQGSGLKGLYDAIDAKYADLPPVKICKERAVSGR